MRIALAIWSPVILVAVGVPPDGFQAEYLKITLKAQNLELGKDVITEIARYATAFGAGLLPAHTYYVGSGSWLVPVIKARLTDTAAVPPLLLLKYDLSNST